MTNYDPTCAGCVAGVNPSHHHDAQCSFCGMPLRDASSVEWVDLGGGDQAPYCADSDCYRRDWNAN